MLTFPALGQKSFLSDAKQRIREWVFSHGPKHDLLLMPGPLAPDVETAIQSGAITPESNFTCVEKDRIRYFQMRRSLSRIVPYNYRPPIMLCADLADVRPTANYDLLWADLCGNLTRNLTIELREKLIPSLAAGADLFFTFSGTPRGNPFIRRIRGERTLSATQLSLLRYVMAERPYTIGGMRSYINPGCRARMTVIHFSLGETMQKTKASASINNLTTQYLHAYGDYDAMRGFRRSLTLFLREHPSPEYAKRSLKAWITRKGGNPCEV